MAEGILLLAIGVIACGLFAACDRGIRLTGPSWFDIVHPTNRAARRSNQRR